MIDRSFSADMARLAPEVGGTLHMRIATALEHGMAYAQSASTCSSMAMSEARLSSDAPSKLRSIRSHPAPSDECCAAVSAV